MPSWVNETAHVDRLAVGHLYSKRQVAELLEVTVPAGSRDWGGIVRFANAVALFITLEKGADRYAQEHRYNDRFDSDLLYWDSRASHDKTSRQVKSLRVAEVATFAFARITEKSEAGRTRPFCYVGPLDFVDWWGTKPVRFTWRLRAFPDGIGGTAELEELAEWGPHHGARIPERRVHPATSRTPSSPGNRGGTSGPVTEGGKRLAMTNRYERDPRARRECLDALGTACTVCEFDFGRTYGALGDGFIYVHHRVPVAVRARSGEYELDPVRDLVPICGNCHAIVHRREPVGGSQAGPPSLKEDAVVRLLELRRFALLQEWEAIE